MKGIGEAQLAPNYLLAQWFNDDGVDRDARRFFKAVATKAPHLDDIMRGLSENRRTDFDFRFDGQPAVGLGVAYLLDGPAASLGIVDAFRSDPVAIDLCSLDSEGQFRQETVSVCSIVTPEQVAARADWIRERIEAERRALRGMVNGEQLWERKEHRWPHLVFCERVRPQVLQLHGTELFFAQIIRHLDLLEGATEAWDGGKFPLRGVAWSYESASTMNDHDLAALRKFAFPDGLVRVCSPHTKILGANIRIHFYPDLGRRTTYIGYVGPHLQI